MAGFASVDPLEPIVPDTPSPDPGSELPDHPDAPKRWRLTRRWIAVGVVTVVLGAGIGASALVNVPYYLLSPGSVRKTEDLISVQGAPSYTDDSGQVGFTTVSVQQATALTWTLAHLDDTITIASEESIRGTQTPEQYRQANVQMMSSSKDTASAVALQRLGYDVKVNGTGALIALVPDGSPSAGVLEKDDTIVSLAGTPITRSDELIDVLGTHSPGETVTVGVQPYRDDGTRTTEERTVTLGARPDDTSQAFLGVASATRDLTYDLPVQISVDSGTVGGPSAGLAFTLGIMDVLTPGSITGGHKVATTGTMRPDGTVGEVGGVHQKTLAVRASGAELFLVPRSEYDEAEKYAGPLRVEPVDTIDDALKVLATIGGGTDVVAKGP